MFEIQPQNHSVPGAPSLADLRFASDFLKVLDDTHRNPGAPPWSTRIPKSKTLASPPQGFSSGEDPSF